MVVSAVFFIDLKGKVLISRNYRGDVTRSQAERFSQKIQETDPTELKPVFVDAGVTYIYIQVIKNTAEVNVDLLCVTRPLPPLPPHKLCFSKQ